MKAQSIKDAFTKHMGAKLIALFVALFIWFNASGQQQATRFYVVPMKFINIPDSLTIVGAVPTETEVSISGTRRELLFLGFKRIEVVVNLAAAASGHFRQRLSASNIIARGGLDTRNVRIISPSSIDLLFEQLLSRMIPVDLTITGSLPPGYVVMEGPKVEPSEILVKGPRASITHLITVPTKPVDLGRVRESFQREVEIDYNNQIYTCEPDRVTVSVSISQLGERVLPNVPPTVLIDEGGVIAEVTPNVVSVTLEGLRSVLDTLSSGDISILLDLSGKPPGRYTLAPDVIVPQGVGGYSLSVDSITVIVRESALQESP